MPVPVIPASDEPFRGPAHRVASVIQGPWLEMDPEQDLETPGEQPIAPDLAQQVARRALQQAFREPQLTLDDILTQRTVVAWRSVRFLLQLLGIDGAEGLLATTLDRYPPFQTLPPRPDLGTDDWKVPPALRKVQQEWVQRPLSPLPHDKMAPDELAQYRRAIAACARALGIPEGAPDSRSLGKYGLTFLRSESLLEGFPQPFQLVMWEQRLAEAVMDRLPATGDWQVVKWLRAKFALGDSESKAILDAARNLAVAWSSQTDDSRRAIMTMRLEKLISRTADADPRVALASMKTLALVQGLTKSEAAEDRFRLDVDSLQEVVEESQEEALKALELDP